MSFENFRQEDNRVALSMDLKNEKKNYKEWKTGFTLYTSDTKKWSKEKIEANDAVEARVVFENFSVEDQGRSRKLICVCATAEQAAIVCVKYNLLISELNKK